jgi:hypothetical protein
VPGLPLESKAAAGNPGVGARVLARIFSRHILNAALLVLLALYATGFLTRPELPQGDSDIWWHLANARILSTTHSFIHIEPYSFSVAGDDGSILNGCLRCRSGMATRRWDSGASIL